jgi:hypothetical protein
MENNKKGFVAIGIIVVLGLIVWKITAKPKEKSKKDYVDNIYNSVIDDRSVEAYNKLLSYDLEYLKSWSDGIDAKISLFDYNGNKYFTSSGTASGGIR